MFTLNKEKTENNFSGIRMFYIYVSVTVFCMIFSMIYGRYSHNVTSVYMTYLFAWPLVLGAVPGIFLSLIKRMGNVGRVGINAYNSGVAAITVSSLLKGIFEIAGTASALQTYLTYAGVVMLVVGIVLLIIEIVGRNR